MFLSVVEKHAPLRTMRVRERSSLWITAEMIEIFLKPGYLKDSNAAAHSVDTGIS